MSHETILYEVEGALAILRFNRPEARNAILPEMGDLLVELLDRAESDPAVRVLVLTGEGTAFSAGADLKRVGESGRLGRPAIVGRERGLHGASVVERLLRREKPLIAAVNGDVAGMACAYVLASDFAIAAEEARFHFGFVRIGFAPDCGTTYLLPRRVGLAEAKRICLTGLPVDSREALRLGLVSEVVPRDRLAGRVREVAETVASHPPEAVRRTRALLELGSEADFRKAVELEALTQGALGEMEDHKEAVRAFLEKRPPVFTGK
ncbi:MAG: enoyl-CoA hydratase [Candidatus Binatia bacterium]|nr:MAG: enoyl-CoA hydratase [Candidatus Binatia bacterium]